MNGIENSANAGAKDLFIMEHPLRLKSFGTIGDWTAWREVWERAETAEELISILHYWPSDCINQSRESIICFYFEVADGCQGDFTFPYHGGEEARYHSKMGGGEHTYRQRELRREIARKAWQVLCNEFFTDKPTDNVPSWWNDILNPTIFAKLLWFFRPIQGSSHNNFPPRRHKSDHYVEVTYKFLAEFLDVVLSYDYLNPPFRERLHDHARMRKVQEMFQAAQPELLAIAREADLLELLLREGVVLGKQTIKLLKKAALATKNEKGLLPGEKVPYCRTIEEALWNGSKDAEVHLLLGAKMEMERRHHTRLQAFEQREAANRKLRVEK